MEWWSAVVRNSNGAKYHEGHSDNGIGFPESIDPTKARSLGMELVNILVGQINGKIDMQVNGGTTWTITFPVKDEKGWRNE